LLFYYHCSFCAIRLYSLRTVGLLNGDYVLTVDNNQWIRFVNLGRHDW